MTPKAQSVLATEILGHKRESKRFKMADGKIVTGYRWTCAHQGGGFHGWGFQQSQEAADSYVPMFHTDANASLQLVDWMKGRGWRLTMTQQKSDYGICFSKGDEYPSYSAPTIPLAILGAFLKANGEEIH